MVSFTRDQWARLITDCDPPTIEEVASKLADRFDLDVEYAREQIDKAIKSDSPVEYDSDLGIYGGLVVQPDFDQGERDEESSGTADAESPKLNALEEHEADSNHGDPSTGDREDSEPAPNAADSTPSYAELYLQARERADADQAYVPHEDIEAVFQQHGWGDIVDHLKFNSEWLVWTPDSRDTPLYAYTPDLAGDTSADRERLAELLSDAGAGTKRFIDVHDGQKGSFDTGNARLPDDPEINGNYGVKGGRGGDESGKWLVDIDVDDYDEAKTAHERVDELRNETLAVASAHTSTERPGHLYVVVDGDPRAVVRDLHGRAVDNPQASFGEIRIEQQYVVGPGSEILCGCDRCQAPDAPDHFGRYELAQAKPPVEWSEAEFREFLEQDPKIQADIEAAQAAGDRLSGGADGDSDSPSGGSLQDDASGRVEFAATVDDYVASSLREVRNPDDRSHADAMLARSVGPWLAYDESEIAAVLDTHGTSKWQNRGSSYRDSILSYAQNRSTDRYETIPYWALVEYATSEGIVGEDELIQRDSESRDPVDDPEAHNGETYTALPSVEAYNATLDAVEDLGVDHSRDRAGSSEYRFEDDPRDLFDEPVVVEPQDAWRAAGAVEPSDLHPDPKNSDRTLSFEATDDGTAWVTDDGHRISDVVRAVALEEGLIEAINEELTNGTFDEAYRRARWYYDAPLPEYMDETTATEHRWVIQGALRQIEHWHLDWIRSEVTALGDGDVVAEIDPYWADSASGRRILAFESGLFYCREHEKALDPLRFVALEEGILDGCEDALGEEGFVDAVAALRERGAPVPRWEGEEADHAPVLPDPDELLEEFDTDADRLQEARDEVEALIEETTTDWSNAHLVTALPALGKTTSAVKNARSTPTLYAAPRKELQQEVVDKAEEFGVTSYILPVLAEEHIKRDAKRAAAGAVREEGQQLLRDRDELLDRINCEIIPNPDPEDIEDEVHLDRVSCPTANGMHGVDWQVAVQAAVELGYSPRYIHQHAKALFGEELPCQHDEDSHETDCPYSTAWERVADPDRPVDLLVGSRSHAHVTSARTRYRRDNDDNVTVDPRAVIIDEFPGDAYGRRFGEEAPAIATWLATALRADIEDRSDLGQADLWDSWVHDWLTGRGEDIDALQRIGNHIEVARAILDVKEVITDVRPADRPQAAEKLRHDIETGFGRGSDPQQVTQVVDVVHRVIENTDLTGTVENDVLDALRDLLDALNRIDEPLGDPSYTVDDDTLGETFQELTETALSGAFEEGEDHALSAAQDAVEGGEEGCAALAVYADDPYAHPAAYLLLAGMVSDREIVETSEFGFNSQAVTTRVNRTHIDNATVLFDRDHNGAFVLNPPEFTGITGRDCPVVGLDATGRERLWEIAIGQTVKRRDIHDSKRRRQAFLRDVLNLQVVQSSPHVNSYSYIGSKNFDADVELIREISHSYGRGAGARLRSDTLSATTNPGVITTKKARAEIEDRVDNDVETIDHYGNVIGSNDLAECNIGAVLGSRHFGDATVELWAALAGQETTRTGRGTDLSYDSEVANLFLKHMREDETMQAILRFGRDQEGALVFCHTSAIRDDLPVVADGAVVSAHSHAGVEVRDAMLPFLQRGETFTVSDLEDKVEASRRTIQRKLAEFAQLGYLTRDDPGTGLANEFTATADPGVGEVSIPEVDSPSGPPDESSYIHYNTGIVGVRGENSPSRGIEADRQAQLPAPDGNQLDPPSGSAG